MHSIKWSIKAPNIALKVKQLNVGKYDQELPQLHSADPAYGIVTTIQRTFASEKAIQVKTTISLLLSVIKDTDHFIKQTKGPDTTQPHKEWKKTINTESTKTQSNYAT